MRNLNVCFKKFAIVFVFQIVKIFKSSFIYLKHEFLQLINQTS